MFLSGKRVELRTVKKEDLETLSVLTNKRDIAKLTGEV